MLYVAIDSPVVTTPTAPDSGSDPEIPPAAGKQKAKRGFGGYLVGFIALLVLAAACGGTSSTTTPAVTTSSAGATTSATDSATPSPADSSPSPPPAAPPVIPTTPITTAPANPPPPPVPTTQAPQPAPTTAQVQGCYPLTSGGNCYKPGEYCRNSDHGATGTDADGDAIKCEYNNGWRWERV